MRKQQPQEAAAPVPKTAVVYYRVSSIQQKQSDSIERQRMLLPALAKRRGLRIVRDYADDGLPGAMIDKRPGLMSLLADLPKLQPEYLLCLRPDRLGRPEEWSVLLQLVNTAPANKVHLLFLAEDDLTGELVPEVVHWDRPEELYRFQGKLLRAGQENARRGRDVRQGKFARVLRGQWPYPSVPFGFRWDRTAGRFVTVPKEIKLIRWLYAQVVVAGRGAPSIAAELRRKGVLTAKCQQNTVFRRTMVAKRPGGDTRWCHATVRNLLAREHFGTGLMRFDVGSRYADLLSAYREGRGVDDAASSRITPDGFVEFPLLVDGGPVVPPAVWKKAREIISRRHRRRGGQRRGEATKYLFGPWLRCECGGCITARTGGGRRQRRGKTENAWFRYVCRDHDSEANRDGRPFCDSPPLDADAIDARLWEMLATWLTDPHPVLEKWLAENGNAADPAALEKELAGRLADLKGHEANQRKWLDLFGVDAIDKAELTRRVRADVSAVAEAQAAIATLERRLEATRRHVDVAAAARDGFKEYGKLMLAGAADLRRQLDALGFAGRRTLLQRLLGTGEIVLAWRDLAPIRGILKRRRQDVDDYMARWVVLTDAKGVEALFVAGVLLPVRPADALAALESVGVRPKGNFRKCLTIVRQSVEKWQAGTQDG